TGHGRGFAGAADVGEGEWGPARPAVRKREVLEQRLHVERRIAQAHVTLAHYRAAMAEHAIRGEALAQQPPCLTQAHGVLAVGIWGHVEAIMIPEGAGVVAGGFLEAAPVLPGGVKYFERPRPGVEGPPQERLAAALRRGVVVPGAQGWGPRQEQQTGGGQGQKAPSHEE